MTFRLLWIKWDDDGAGPLRPDPSSRFSQIPGARYEQRGDALLRREPLASGDFRFTELTNFAARIVGDLLLDDGERERREFGIEAELGGRKMTFALAAAEFGRMNWVLDRLGPEAIVYPGKQQHARAAIQSVSRQIRQERIFTHLGWTKQDGEWVYLHAGSALHAPQNRTSVSVQLPSVLELYRIEPPESLDEQAKAIRASLHCLALAPDRVSFPLLGAVYRAVFGKADFSLFLTGRTGVFKTQLAAIAQQHFGPALDAAHLPGNFASTANALEALTFHAKDALVVVDDFAPTGMHGDNRLESVAERLFRAVGNRQGRSRMSGNGRLQRPRPPRALLVATGEELPKGHSIRSRLLIVEIAPGDVDVTRSPSANALPPAGTWPPPSVRLSPGSRSTMKSGRNVLKRAPANSATRAWAGAHTLGCPRPSLRSRADLRCGSSSPQKPARSICPSEWLSKSDAGKRSRNWPPVKLAITKPAIQHVDLSGFRRRPSPVAKHISQTVEATHPSRQARGGWHHQANEEWVPQGVRIGWIVKDDLFLDPPVSYQLAQAMAGAERMPLSPQTLHHRLREAGLLASIDTGRQMVQVRRTLEGHARQVLHLKSKNLIEEFRGESVPGWLLDQRCHI